MNMSVCYIRIYTVWALFGNSPVHVGGRVQGEPKATSTQLADEISITHPIDASHQPQNQNHRLPLEKRIPTFLRNNIRKLINPTLKGSKESNKKNAALPPAPSISNALGKWHVTRPHGSLTANLPLPTAFSSSQETPPIRDAGAGGRVYQGRV